MQVSVRLALLLTAGAAVVSGVAKLHLDPKHCSFAAADYSLQWAFEPHSRNVVFVLKHRNTLKNFWTGVGFGDRKKELVDFVGVFVKNGQIGIADTHIDAHGTLTPDSVTNVQSIAFDYVNGSVTAKFARALKSNDKKFDHSLDGCQTFHFAVNGGAISRSGIVPDFDEIPERRICDIDTHCVVDIKTRPTGDDDEHSNETATAWAATALGHNGGPDGWAPLVLDWAMPLDSSDTTPDAPATPVPDTEAPERPLADAKKTMLREEDVAHSVDISGTGDPCSFQGVGYSVNWTYDPVTDLVDFSMQHPVKSGKWWSAVGIGDTMADMDIAIIFISSGRPKRIRDYYSNSYTVPEEDAKQDWTLSRSRTKTVDGTVHLGFSRKLNTGDNDKDRSLDNCVLFQFAANAGNYGTGFAVQKHKDWPDLYKACDLKHKCVTADTKRSDPEVSDSLDEGSEDETVEVVAPEGSGHDEVTASGEHLSTTTLLIHMPKRSDPEAPAVDAEAVEATTPPVDGTDSQTPVDGTTEVPPVPADGAAVPADASTTVSTASDATTVPSAVDSTGTPAPVPLHLPGEADTDATSPSPEETTTPDGTVTRPPNVPIIMNGELNSHYRPGESSDATGAPGEGVTGVGVEGVTAASATAEQAGSSVPVGEEGLSVTPASELEISSAPGGEAGVSQSPAVLEAGVTALPANTEPGTAPDQTVSNAPAEPGVSPLPGNVPEAPFVTAVAPVEGSSVPAVTEQSPPTTVASPMDGINPAVDVSSTLAPLLLPENASGGPDATVSSVTPENVVAESTAVPSESSVGFGIQSTFVPEADRNPSEAPAAFTIASSFNPIASDAPTTLGQLLGGLTASTVVVPIAGQSDLPVVTEATTPSVPALNGELLGVTQPTAVESSSESAVVSNLPATTGASVEATTTTAGGFFSNLLDKFNGNAATASTVAAEVPTTTAITGESVVFNVASSTPQTSEAVGSAETAASVNPTTTVSAEGGVTGSVESTSAAPESKSGAAGESSAAPTEEVSGVSSDIVTGAPEAVTASPVEESTPSLATVIAPASVTTAPEESVEGSGEDVVSTTRGFWSHLLDAATTTQPTAEPADAVTANAVPEGSGEVETTPVPGPLTEVERLQNELGKDAIGNPKDNCGANHEDISSCKGYFENYLNRVQVWAVSNHQAMDAQYGKACTLLEQVPNVPTLCCTVFLETCRDKISL